MCIRFFYMISCFSGGFSLGHQEVWGLKTSTNLKEEPGGTMKDSTFPQLPSQLPIQIFQECYEICFLSMHHQFTSSPGGYVFPWENMGKLWELASSQGPFSGISKMLADLRSFSHETAVWKPTATAGVTGLRLAGCRHRCALLFLGAGYQGRTLMRQPGGGGTTSVRVGLQSSYGFIPAPFPAVNAMEILVHVLKAALNGVF